MSQKYSFSLSLPSLYQTGERGNKDWHHSFEVRPNLPRASGRKRTTKYSAVYDDCSMVHSVVPIPDELTDDESLSYNEWVLACLDLLLNNPESPFVGEWRDTIIKDVTEHLNNPNNSRY